MMLYLVGRSAFASFAIRRLGFWFPHQRVTISKRAVSGNRSPCLRMANGSPLPPRTQAARFRVFLRDFSEPESRPVADGEGGYSVVWSPDGQSLLFTSQGKLRRIGVNASVSQVVSDSSPVLFLGDPLRVRPLARMQSQELWRDPFIRRTAARRLTSGTRGRSCCRADETFFIQSTIRNSVPCVRALRRSEAANKVSRLSNPIPACSTRVRSAPTGDTWCICAPELCSRNHSIWPDDGSPVTRRPSPATSLLLDIAARPIFRFRHGVYLPTNPLPAARNSSGWTGRVNGFLPRALPGINASYVRLSPDGRSLATAVFDVDRGVTDVWVYDTRTGAGRKAISGPGISHVPVWSPDSRRLVYLWDRSWPRLALSSLDGTPDPEPLPNTGFMAPTDWSPDGRFILYNNSALPAITQRFPSDVFAIDMARGRKVIPLLKTQFFENGAVFSPDGKWLAFLSDESGKAEIYVQAIDRGDDSLRVTGERFLISRQGAQCLRWRKDGRELYYLGLDGQVYAVPLAFRAGGSPRGEARGAFHDRCRSPRHLSLGCLIRCFR